MQKFQQRMLLSTSIQKNLEKTDLTKTDLIIVTVIHLRKKIYMLTWKRIWHGKLYTIQTKLIWLSLTTYFPQPRTSAKIQRFIHLDPPWPTSMNPVSLLFLIYIGNILDLYYRQNDKITEL